MSGGGTRLGFKGQAAFEMGLEERVGLDIQGKGGVGWAKAGKCNKNSIIFRGNVVSGIWVHCRLYDSPFGQISESW